jgi:hypothetical protein
VTRISSRLTTFHKRIFPLIWLLGAGGALFVAGIIDVSRFGLANSGGNLVMAVVFGIAGYFMIGFRVWDLVDEVYDCDDYLLVKNRGLEEAIPLSSVMNVSTTLMTSYPRVTLRLTEPSSFGKEIAFWPAELFSVNPFSRSSIVDDLIIRVDRPGRSGRTYTRD